MQTSRPPFILAVLVLALAAACTSNGNGSTTTGGGSGNGTGNGSGSGTTSASPTGTSSGNSSAAGTTGTTGAPPQDPIGTKCAKTGNAEYQSCSTSLDCACPLLCGLDLTRGRGIADAGGSICVAPCKTTADCPEIFTNCQDGLCTLNICEADAGGGAFFGPCDAAGTNDGTCEPTTSVAQDDVIGVCIQSGSVDVDAGVCDPNQQSSACATPPCALLPLPLGVENTKRPPASVLCPIGYLCVATGPTSGACQLLCDPVASVLSDNDAGACLDGKNCVPVGYDTAFGGECIVQGDGGCAADGTGQGELVGCQQSKDCECPLECEVDVNSLRHVCEVPCTETLGDGGCDIPYTSCQRSITGLPYCNYNYCVQTYYGQPTQWLPDAGSYGGPCNYAAVGDGICQPEYDQTAFGNVGPFGYCEPAGSVAVGGSCDDPPYCGKDAICVGPMGGPYNCAALCQPFLDGGNGGCAKSTDGCFTVIPPPLEQVAGYCAACSTPGNPCDNSPECCDGYCAYAQPDAGNGFCN